MSSSALAGAATHHGPAVLYVACAPASCPTAASRHVASRRTAPRITHPAYVCVCSGEGWVVFGRQNGPTPARARPVHAPRTRARTLHSRATIRARLPTVALRALAYGGHAGRGLSAFWFIGFAKPWAFRIPIISPCTVPRPRAPQIQVTDKGDVLGAEETSTLKKSASAPAAPAATATAPMTMMMGTFPLRVSRSAWAALVQPR